MKLDFNFTIKDLDGVDVKPSAANDVVNAGKIIAHSLVTTSKGDALKHFDWAIKLQKGEPIEPDRTDTAYLKKFIADHPTLPILTKAQVLEKFEKE